MTERVCDVCGQYESCSMHSIGDLRYHAFYESDALEPFTQPRPKASTTAEKLRNKYGLRPHISGNPEREREWNELARIFVQRFQQIRRIPDDSLAGPHAFRLLDTLTEGCPRCLAKPGEVHLRDCKV